MSSTHVLDLPPNCVNRIYSLLPAADLARAGEVHRLWGDHAFDEALWRPNLLTDFLTATPLAPGGQALPSFRRAYRAWRLACRHVPWPMLQRALLAWRAIQGWLEVHFPDILATLRPGATDEELAAAGDELGAELPPAMQAIYRLHDGQALAFDQARDQGGRPPAQASLFHGLFGGVTFYDHTSNVRLLPLTRVVRLTKKYNSPEALVAMSFNETKVYTVDLGSGDLVVSLAEQRGFCHASPPSHPDPADADAQGGGGDGVLRWFEEYSRRLASGHYDITMLRPDMGALSRGICTFPVLPPGMGSQVTCGVLVRTSTTYVPESSSVGRGGRTQHVFTYTVRFSLLHPEEQRKHWSSPSEPFRAVTCCQLMTRHWVISDAQGNVVDEVRGDAVVGLYPLLRPGEPEVVYESCTSFGGDMSTMDGEFRFVEGTRQAPTGPEWDVIAPRLTMRVPDYIF